MKRRTLRLDDLKTLAAVCHEYDAIDWPPRAEGGWATATLNGHPYRARVEPEPVEPSHACPPGDSGLMPCCGRTPFEVPRTDRMTLDADLVTCKGIAP